MHLPLIRLPQIALGAVAFLSAMTLPATALEKLADGIVVPVGDKFLKLEDHTESIIRVACAQDPGFFARPSLMLAEARTQPPGWELKEEPGAATLATAKLRVRIDLATGAVAFFDAARHLVLAEQKRTLEPVFVQGERTFHVRQEWAPNDGEALYGLGQNQLGLLDLKGYDLDLWQRNTIVAVPLLASSRGYGILWDNTSYTRFGDLRQPEPMPAAQLFDKHGQPGGLTGSYFTGGNFDRLVAERTDARIDIDVRGVGPGAHARIHPDLPAGDISIRWEGEVEPAVSGDHCFHGFADGGLKLWIDGRLVMNHWRQNWLPSDDVARVHLEAGKRHKIRLDWVNDQGATNMRLLWKTPPASDATALWSEVGEGTDYYFIHGPELDRVVAGYRHLTGGAPLMPRWAFGLWQSRQRYMTAQESLDAVDGFRARQIPFDVIVQDWFYWRRDQWGSHEFDPDRFPDPAAWAKGIHDRNARLMISVWGKFYPGTDNFAEMRRRGFLYEPGLAENRVDWLGFPFTYYDAFSADARSLFWSQIENRLFRRLKVDAWWMDATEPDFGDVFSLQRQHTHMHPTALGTGARFLNAYALVNARGIYENQRAAAPGQRVFNLTRSGFSGQQRYAAATWSGDITSTWTALAKQITAGLGFSLSGVPYWTMDTGGFSVPKRYVPRQSPHPDLPTGTTTLEDTEEWRELQARWFQFGTFVPVLRQHGEFPFREMWEYGGETHPAYQACLKFDRLRYRLLPYVYSLAADVTFNGGTPMRALVMDFRTDPAACEIADQYLFGPAFLVSPVTTYKARSRTVYLPAGAGWYDFWTGRALAGGQ